MRYAQIKTGNKLHLVCEPGEGHSGKIVKAGELSAPICGTSAFKGEYRMTINLPLNHSCQNCQRVWRSWI